jgi:hypothetical protein
MWPTIRHGDMLEIEPDGKRLLHLGEIVLIQVEGKDPLVHRIIRVFEDAVITQGDRARTPDGVIRKAQIIGRVVAFQRRGSWTRLDRKMDRYTGYILAKTLPFVKKIIYIGRRTEQEPQEI